MRRPIQALLIAASLLSSQAMAGPQEDQRARNAVRVLAEIQEIPEQGIPDKLLDEGRAVIVIPDTIKAGLVIGGRRGHGLMSVRMPNGAWSNPVFVKLTGGSIGFQAGVQSSDVVLVFRNDRSLDNLVNGKFTLGADAGVAAGPVGRNAAAATDGQLKAEIWSWSRARGLFAGVALDGAVLQIDDAANLDAYGSNHAADDLRRPRRRFAVDGCGRLPRSPGRGHLRGAQQPQRQRRQRAAPGCRPGSCSGACSGSTGCAG